MNEELPGVAESETALTEGGTLLENQCSATSHARCSLKCSLLVLLGKAAPQEGLPGCAASSALLGWPSTRSLPFLADMLHVMQEWCTEGAQLGAY